MKPRAARFHDADHRLRADTCDPLVAAVNAGKVRLHAWVRGGYPGRPIPERILPQVRTIGFWDAARDQSWGLDEHRNEGIEITYLDNGRLEFVAAGQSHSLKPGAVTITRPWQPHRVGNPAVAASRLYWLILDVGVRQPHQSWRWPPWLVLAPADLKDLTKLLRENEHPVWPGSPEIRRCFTAIGQLIEATPEGPIPSSRLTLLINELLVFLLDMLRLQNPPCASSLTLGERSVAMFLEAMKHDLANPWTLDEMAQKSGLARTRFAHHCRKLTNLAPMAYLQHLRIEQAKRLLTNSKHSITNIAMDCGFASSAYFSSVFRNHTQSTPMAYRQSPQ